MWNLSNLSYFTSLTVLVSFSSDPSWTFIRDLSLALIVISEPLKTVYLNPKESYICHQIFFSRSSQQFSFYYLSPRVLSFCLGLLYRRNPSPSHVYFLYILSIFDTTPLSVVLSIKVHHWLVTIVCVSSIDYPQSLGLSSKLGYFVTFSPTMLEFYTLLLPTTTFTSDKNVAQRGLLLLLLLPSASYVGPSPFPLNSHFLPNHPNIWLPIVDYHSTPQLLHSLYLILSPRTKSSKNFLHPSSVPPPWEEGNVETLSLVLCPMYLVDSVFSFNFHEDILLNFDLKTK